MQCSRPSPTVPSPVRSGPYRIPPGSPRQREGLLVRSPLVIIAITSAKNDVAALELSRQLGVKWDTAWLIKQKLLEVMLERNATYKLQGDIQVDDAYLGGEKPGKGGRGAGNKVPLGSEPTISTALASPPMTGWLTW